MSDSELHRQPNVAFIGLGNPFRGDDGIGYALASELHKTFPQSSIFLLHDDFTPILSIFEQHALCFIFDAVAGDKPPGTIIEVDLLHGTLEELTNLATSSHHMSLTQIIELGRQMDLMPQALYLFGVVGKDFTLGAPMGSEVKAAIPAVVKRCGELLKVYAES